MSKNEELNIDDIAAGADLKAIPVRERQKTKLHSRSRSFLTQTNDEIETAKEEGVQEISVSVDDCCLWPFNDRIYEGLNMENCKTLVDDIQMNTQLQAVVARKDPTGKKDYEIIIGTRRFWACQHTTAKTIKLVIIEADDKHAYKIMRSENAERDDTTTYEKAINAKRVISDIYGGSQKEYCIENDIPEPTLSCWMAISDMEPEIVSILPNMYEVTVKQAIKLRAVINKSAKAKKAVLEKAKEIKGMGSSTSTMLATLIVAGEEAIKPKPRGPKMKEYMVAGDKKGVVVKEATNGVLSIKISKKAKEDKLAILNALKEHLG